MLLRKPADRIGLTRGDSRTAAEVHLARLPQAVLLAGPRQAERAKGERFISYATGPISGTPDLFGRMGWDHREQAQALTTYFTNEHGLSTQETTPLLGGVLELQPWLDQWHNEFDPPYGSTPAAFFAGYRATQQGERGLTGEDLPAWRPAPATRRRRRPEGG